MLTRGCGNEVVGEVEEELGVKGLVIKIIVIFQLNITVTTVRGNHIIVVVPFRSVRLLPGPPGPRVEFRRLKLGRITFIRVIFIQKHNYNAPQPSLKVNIMQAITGNTSIISPYASWVSHTNQINVSHHNKFVSQ